MDNFFSIKNETENIVRIELTNGKKHNPLSLKLIKSLTKALGDVSAPVSYTHLTLPTSIQV